MPQFYLVKDVGGGFDGLCVEGDVFDDHPSLVSVGRIIVSGVNVGDRTVSLPVRGLLFAKEMLEPTDDPGLREFAGNNPFGRVILEGHMEIGNLKISYTQFDSAMSVNLYDNVAQKTVFSQYFSKDLDRVRGSLEELMKQNGGSDAEDLVFRLRELKEAENHG